MWKEPDAEFKPLPTPLHLLYLAYHCVASVLGIERFTDGGGGGGYPEGRSPALKAAVAHQRSATVGGCTAYAASHYDCTSYVLHVNRSDVCCVVILFMMLVLQYVGDVIKSGVLHMLHLEHDNARLVLLNF